MNDNKFYKVLRIVFLTLAIISLVFTLAKKVGLCASSSVSALPLPVGAGYGNEFSQSELDTIVANIETAVVAKNDSDVPYCEVILFNGTYNGDYEFLGFSSTDITVNDASDIFTSGATFIFNNVTSYQGCYRVWVDPSTLAVTGDMWRSQKPGVSTLSWFDNGVLKSGYLDLYPLYISSDISYNGVTYFSFHGEEIDPEMADILQNIISGTSDFADQMDDLTSNLPTDSGNKSVGQWLSNIFSVIGGGFSGLFRSFYSFLKPIFDNILGFFQTIIDTVTDGFDSITTTITTFFKKITDIFGWFYQHGLDSDYQFDFMVLFHYLFDFDTTQALTDFSNNKYGDFILDLKTFTVTIYNSIFNAEASSRVFFTIRLGNHFGVQIPDIEINFDWYANIRDQFLPVIMAFIYVSAIWLFIKRLPDIIHGAASAESSFTDALSGQEFAPTSHGLFTKGVSHNQPSLDKGPISGGGGVHSGSSQFWY